MAKVVFDSLAPHIVELVGGEQNVSNFTHCITRLRFNVKDKSKVDVDGINAIEDLSGCMWAGNQLQIVVGTSVGTAYDAVLRHSNLQAQPTVDENLDAPEKPKGVKGFFQNILNVIVECMVPCIPLFMSMGLFSALAAIIGPTGLNLVGADDGLYLALGWTKDALMYGVSGVLAYTAAKKFNVSVICALSLYIICTYTSVITAISDGSFNIFGLSPLPITLQLQSIGIIPAVYLLKHVRNFWGKVLPDNIKYVFQDFLTLLLLVPVTIYVLTPCIYYIGLLIDMPVSLLSSVSAPLASALAGALWIPLVATGTHIAFGGMFTIDFVSTGVNYTLMPSTCAMGFILLALNLAIMVRAKNDKRLKSTAGDCTIAAFIGGVAEPTIYGLLMSRPRLMVSAVAGMGVTGFVLGLAHVGAYGIAPSSFLGPMAYLAGGMPNLIAAIPGVLAGSVVSFVLVMVLGVGEAKDSGMAMPKFD